MDFFKRWLKGNRGNSEDIVVAAGAATQLPKLIEESGKLLEPIAKGLEQHGFPLTELTEALSSNPEIQTFGNITGANTPGAQALAALLLGYGVLRCRTKGRSATDTTLQDIEEGVIRTHIKAENIEAKLEELIGLACASKKRDIRDLEILLGVLGEHSKALNQLNEQFKTLRPDDFNPVAIAGDLKFDPALFDTQFNAIQTVVDQINLKSEESLRRADAILQVVANTASVADLQNALAPLYTQLLRTFQEQIGLEIPQQTTDANADNGQQHLLRYNERLAKDLVAREDEFQILEDFLNDQAPFRWLALTGFGGSGKSRLALEFILRHQDTHHVGFVKKEQRAAKLGDFILRHWPHDKPVILVFDYIQADAAAIAAFLEPLTKGGWDRKVRVILIDRIFTGYSYTKPISKDIGSHGHDDPRLNQYELRLKPLTLDAFLGVFRAAYAAIQKGPARPEHEAKVREAFGQRDGDRLPLLATLAALFAALNPEAMDQGRDWATENLKEWYFDHYFRDHRHREHFQSALHALYLATCVGGTNEDWYDFAEEAARIANAGEAWPVAQNIVGGSGENDAEIPPIEPDPLGEFFARRRLENESFGGPPNRSIASVAKRILRDTLHKNSSLSDNAIAALERALPQALAVFRANDILPGAKEMHPALLPTLARNLDKLGVREWLNNLGEAEVNRLLGDVQRAAEDRVLAATDEQPWNEDLRPELEALTAEFESLYRETTVMTIEERKERFDAARIRLENLSQSIADAGADDVATLAKLHYQASHVSQILGDYLAMRDHAGRSMGLARRATEASPGGEAPLRALRGALIKTGDFENTVEGNRNASEAAYRESLEIARRIVANFGETPESLRDLYVSLIRVGDFDFRVRGDAAASGASYRESLEICRRIVARFSETPQSLSDVAWSLDRVGDFDLQVRGDAEASEASYRESLEIRRRIVATFGETPESLCDVLVSLIRVGDFDLQVGGDAEAAGASYREALEIARRIVASFGETPEALRDVSVSLHRLGDFDLKVRGDAEAAGASYHEALEIARRIVASFGETPQSLRDVSVSLDRVGDFDLQVRGDAEAAGAAYRESLEIRRRIVASFGETPQSLRDLSLSLDRVGDFDLEVRGDAEAAEASYRESLEIARRIVASFGETPQALEDLIPSLVRMAGFVDDPAPYWQEAYATIVRRNRRYDPSIQSREWEMIVLNELKNRNIPIPDVSVEPKAP